MTNKEYLLSLLGFSPGPNQAESALLDAGLSGSDTYTTANSVTLKTAAIRVMRTLLTTADTSNNTTGFAIKYDRAAILKLISSYENEIGVVTDKPTISSRRAW